jgi:hypothetical protein
VHFRYFALCKKSTRPKVQDAVRRHSCGLV